MRRNASDLTAGPIFKTLAAYSLPIIILNVVLSVFHAADIAVLSFMVGDKAVAAVGACGTIITLLTSFFSAFATGAEVLVAKRTGSGDREGVKKASGTAVLVGFLSGLILCVAAVIFARKLLVATNCQPEVLDMAVTYMRIYFLGMPVIMLYSFAAAVLRASGDSLRPMIYMLICGALNIVLNVFFVAALKLTVSGVALATVISNLVALVMILVRMRGHDCICRIEGKNLRLGGEEFKEIFRVAVPTSLCSIFFYVANVILAAAVNDLSTEAMTANAISGHFDGLVYTVGCAIAVATSAMVGQNYGARRFDRVKSTVFTGLIYATGASLALGGIIVCVARPVLGLMTDDMTVADLAFDKLTLLCLTYFVTSVMEVFAFSLRALRREKSTMVVGAIAGMGIRCAWAWFVWPLHPTLPMLFSCYAISALIAAVIYSFVFAKTLRGFMT